MAVLAPVTRQRFFSADGSPLAGGKVYTYEAGTTTPKTAWKDANKVTEHSNPIILDSEGRMDDELYLEGVYKIAVYSSDDILQYEDDNIDPLGVGDYVSRSYPDLATALADSTLREGDRGSITGVGDFEVVATDTGGLDATANGFLKITSAKTYKPLTLYVATTGSDSNSGFTSGSPKRTPQQALDALPSIIEHDVLISIANGIYTDVGGQDEFGRDVLVDLSKKHISIDKDLTQALNYKGAKIRIEGESEAGVIFDGLDVNNTRYGFWIHEVQGVLLSNITVRNCYCGIASHQNADATLHDVTTTSNTYGRFAESNSRLEVLRGSNTGNTFGYFLKNGQLQENDSTLGSNTQNDMIINGSSYVYMLRVAGSASAGKNYISSKGSGYIEFDDCDISGGNAFIEGTFTALRLSNGARLHGFTSAPFIHEFGYVETSGLCHIHNNAFIAYCTRGTPVFNLDNCDSLNDLAVDEPNTNGIRILCGATSARLDDACSVTSSDKILQRPSSGLIFKGTTPPAETDVYYERGAICLNESYTGLGDVPYWINNTKGYAGAANWVEAPKQAAHQADSTATDVAGVVADLNALIAKLEAANIMASS